MENQLLKKLKLKPEHLFLILNAPEGYVADLRKHHSRIESNNYSLAFADVVQLFATHKSDLEIELDKLQSLLKSNPIIWIAHPKKSSKIPTDLESMQQWEPLKRLQLRPVATISINDSWTALQIKPENQVKKSTSSNSEVAESEYADFINQEKREVSIPKELQTVLKNEQDAFKFFNSLSFSNLDFKCQAGKNKARTFRKNCRKA